MPRRSRYTEEFIRKVSSMSAQIVSLKEKEYGIMADYAGGNFESVRKMAFIDVLLEEKMFPAAVDPLIRFYRKFLNQERKAFFATVGSSEISKLGFILGMGKSARSAKFR